MGLNCRRRASSRKDLHRERVMKCWGGCLSPPSEIFNEGRQQLGEGGQGPGWHRLREGVPAHHQPSLLALCICIPVHMHFALLTSCGDLDLA